MKILKLILVIAGAVLVGFGLYTGFVPQEVLDNGSIAVSIKKGLNDQTLGMIGLGVVALIAGAFLGSSN
ncbi:MAG: hypothetical protein ACI836_001558 [Saprospiraceae bacterium]|jgi:hypothetical protein|uniref:hypothetical protein n=1 Tax=Patiriisocius sp. Uisw_047 TaxID=3230969 RepID=UPI0039EADCCC